MGPLIINYANGAYELLISGVEGPAGTVSLIAGADAGATVQLLAESMSQGFNAVVMNSEFIFDVGGVLNADGVSAIFSSVDSLIFGEGIGIFEAAQGTTLLDAIVAAGEALLEFLAA